MPFRDDDARHVVQKQDIDGRQLRPILCKISPGLRSVHRLFVGKQLSVRKLLSGQPIRLYPLHGTAINHPY